ncbi:DUF1707 domain-containing protein [Geodermatophilus sp. SYSU D01180]
MPEPHLLAGDADRAAVVTRLDESLADGRLTLAEYEDRSARAHAARTYGELAELTTDLPRPARPAPRPVAAVAYGGAWHGGPWHGAWGHDLRAAWTSWLVTGVIVIGIWLVSVLGSGDLVYPWPVWVVGPWGVVLLARTLGERRSGRPPAA